MKNYNERISKIFNQKTLKNAKLRYSILNNQIKHLPDEIAKFITKLGKDLNNTLSHIETENIPKNQQLARTILQKQSFPKNTEKTIQNNKRSEKILKKMEKSNGTKTQY